MAKPASTHVYLKHEKKKKSIVHIGKVPKMIIVIECLENRNILIEANPLLPERPELEELILQKTLSIYLLRHVRFFIEHPADQWYINSANVLLTGVVLNNLHQINKYD